MTGELVLINLAGLGPLVGVVAARWHYARRWRTNLVAYELRWPRGLEAAQVAAFFNGLSGMVAARWKRTVVQRAVVLELSATERGIVHHLLVPPAQAEFVLATLRAVIPGATATVDEAYEPIHPTAVAGLGLSNRRRQLAVERAGEISAAILSAVQPLKTGERVVVQWVCTPVGPVEPVLAAPPSSGQQPLTARLVQAMTSGRVLTKQEAALAQVKQSGALFAATGRIGVVAGDRRRARQRLGQLLGVHHTANAPGVHLYRRRLLASVVAKAMTARRLPVVAPSCVFNVQELAAVAAFPLGAVTLPGLRLAGARQLAPSAEIPSGPRVLARATFPGAERPLALSVTDSLRHLHVIGPTGVGKSSFLTGLIAQDMASGHGVVVLDPKGDLVADVLDRVPERRTEDVVILDAADDERPCGLNLLAGADDSAELIVDQVTGILHRLYSAFWGPRTDDLVRAGLLSLVHEPGMTLCELPLLLTDPNFRARVVSRLDDPVALEPFWGWYNGLSDAERAQAIGPVMNKLRAFLLRRRLRNVLGQARPALDFDRVLAERKILLVPLTKGVLGEETASLLGSLVVARLWQATQRRAGLAPELRHPTFAVLDEAQDFLNLPTDIADVLQQARGLGLSMTLAHQHLGQLPTSLKAAVMANCRSRVMFQTAATDAHTLARELAPQLEAADLQGLSAYEVVLTLSAGARVAPPVTGRTELPPPPTGMAERARTYSRAHYGMDRAEVEAELRARHEGRHAGGDTLGRREASS